MSVALTGDKAQKKYEELKAAGLIIFETIVGSHSYGLNVETSDVDKKFVYIDNLENVLTGDVCEQINVTDDYVGYEIGRFIELLGKQNPNISEIAFSDPKFHEICHPLFKKLIIDQRDNFISKIVAKSYGAYAYSQVKKAQTTSKKFLTDMSGPRKELIDFAYVLFNHKSIPLKEYLANTGYDPDYLSISRINHARDMYAMFYDEQKRNKYGIFGKNGVDLKLMSLPKDLTHIQNVFINVDGFSVYCKEYAEWQEWNEKKNPQRFAENLENEKKYDRKNMMHCHRLLNVCIEILEGKGLNVLRTHDREYLLGIRYGKSSYQELTDSANEKKTLIEELAKTSTLQDEVSTEFLKETLLGFRKSYYNL